jgi:8-oxo-dGTP diphosphatase
MARYTVMYNFNHLCRQKWAVGVMVIMFLTAVVFVFDRWATDPKACPYVWHGGSPTDSHPGSCWCGADSYCMCTPSLAIDCIIEFNDKVVLVWRKDPPADKFAIPGGFVSVGETAEMATIREVKEETNLTIAKLEQFKMYSDPSRDARRHTVSMVFRVTVNSVADLHTGDDAKSVKVVDLKDVLSLNLAFDHRYIFEDFIRRYHPHLLIN